MLRGVLGSFRWGVGIRMSLRARYLWMVRPGWIRAVDAEGRGERCSGAAILELAVHDFLAVGISRFRSFYC